MTMFDRLDCGQVQRVNYWAIERFIAEKRMERMVSEDDCSLSKKARNMLILIKSINVESD